MEFVVRKTSNGHIKPCEEAYKTQIERWETRICSEQDFDRKFSQKEGTWKSKGDKHKVNKDGHITRFVGMSEAWAMDFKTIEDLFDFVKEHGDIIVKEEPFSSNKPEIEIYDDYRE